MPTVNNEGFVMRCKAVTAILFTLVVPPPKPNQTVISVPGTPIQTYLSIRKPHIVVTHSRYIIPPSLLFNSLQSRMVNISSSISSNHDLRYRAGI